MSKKSRKPPTPPDPLTEYLWPTDLTTATDAELLFLGRNNLRAIATNTADQLAAIDLLLYDVVESGRECARQWADPSTQALCDTTVDELKHLIEQTTFHSLDSYRCIIERLEPLINQAEDKPLHPSLRAQNYFGRGAEIAFYGTATQLDPVYNLITVAHAWTRGRVPYISHRSRRIVNQHGDSRCIAFRATIDGIDCLLEKSRHSYSIMRADDLEYLRQHPEFVDVYTSAGYQPGNDTHDDDRHTTRQNLV